MHISIRIHTGLFSRVLVGYRGRNREGLNSQAPTLGILGLKRFKVLPMVVYALFILVIYSHMWGSPIIYFTTIISGSGWALRSLSCGEWPNLSLSSWGSQGSPSRTKPAGNKIDNENLKKINNQEQDKQLYVFVIAKGLWISDVRIKCWRNNFTKVSEDRFFYSPRMQSII